MLEKNKALDIINSKEFIFECYNINKNDPIYKRIINKSFKENSSIYLHELVYIKLLHYNYKNQVVVGELIIHASIINEIKEIFKNLFNIKYQIYSMRLIDDFWLSNDPIKSDRNSVLNNNTSAFCYRNISNKNTLSNHSKGIAIDINPLENPYIKRNDDGSFNYDELTEYEISVLVNREEKAKYNKHLIVLNDEICNIFEKEGFICGAVWPTISDKYPCDYQHFEPNKDKMRQVNKKIKEIHFK